MTTKPSATPSFEDLVVQGRQVLSQLVAFHEGMARELADQQTELSQTHARQGQLLEELEALRRERQQSAAEQERLVKEGEQLRKEHEQLKELHVHVTELASKLAAEWGARRQALAAENQQLHTELEQTRTTRDLSQEREKQWEVQVRTLQDEVLKLRDIAQRVTLTDEQSYHLNAQLNAIIGFAEVLLDEAGNRATAAEHQEYLQHIKDSGARLADYVHQLTAAPTDGSIPWQPASAQIPLGPPVSQRAAPTVLVADTDAAVRDRIEPFLSGAGYQVEFASDSEEVLKKAVRLQPLAIMIDAALPPNGAMGLVDELLREPRTLDIPIVLTVRNKQEQLGLNFGRFDFLAKPIDQKQVEQMMVKYDLLADRRRASKMPASVLVVDDDPRNTRLVEAMLKPFKIDVLVADGGAAGIKLAFERKPDLVILDLMMPQVDGFEVVSALRKDTAMSQIPILIYTAKKITSDDRRRLQGSIQSIIRKGEFSKEQFLELVYKRGERRNSQSAAETAA